MPPATLLSMFRRLLLLLGISCTVITASISLEVEQTNSLKRLAVVCGAAILEGILKLSPSKDPSWASCRTRPVPAECRTSCGGERISKHTSERACWLCERWRVLYFGQETPWMWSPLLITACDTLGFGTSQSFVDLFTADSVLFQLALHSTLPELLQEMLGDQGGGGGAGLEMWCNNERILWFGGGGGGGSSNSSRGRGSGAGLQTSFGWSLGAGGGGGIEDVFFQDSGDVRKRSFTFGYEKDDLSNVTRPGTAHDVDRLKDYLRSCWRNNSLQVFGGGGSGGSTTSAAIRFNLTECDYRFE